MVLRGGGVHLFVLCGRSDRVCMVERLAAKGKRRRVLVVVNAGAVQRLCARGAVMRRGAAVE